MIAGPTVTRLERLTNPPSPSWAAKVPTEVSGVLKYAWCVLQ